MSVIEALELCIGEPPRLCNVAEVVDNALAFEIDV